MGYFKVRYNSRFVNYDRRGFIRLATYLRFSYLDSAALFMFNLQEIYLFDRIQTSETGCPLYSDTSPYAVNEYSQLKQFVHMEKMIYRSQTRPLNYYYCCTTALTH